MFLKWQLVGQQTLVMTSSDEPLNVPTGADVVLLTVLDGPVAVSTNGQAPDGKRLLQPGFVYPYSGDLGNLVFTQHGPAQGLVSAIFYHQDGAA
jgi:hypothetical protein